MKFTAVQGIGLPALNPDFLYAALDATAYAAFVKESRKKRVIGIETLSQSAKALLPPHKCGGLEFLHISELPIDRQ